MPATLRLTGSGVNAGRLFITPQKRGGCIHRRQPLGGGGTPWWFTERKLNKLLLQLNKAERYLVHLCSLRFPSSVN